MIFEEFENARCSFCHPERKGLGKVCIPHQKILRLIETACRAGNVIDVEQLEKMINDLPNFQCPKCRHFMIWFRGENYSSEEKRQVVTVRFDSDNKPEIICYGCFVSAQHKSATE